MRKKNNSRKMLLGGIAIVSSAITVSCDVEQGVVIPDIDVAQENVHNALSMRRFLSHKDWVYVNFVNLLITELIDNQDLAAEFASDPNEFIKKAGYNDMNISVNERVIKSILALADRDIREKLETKDLRGFMRLCKEKGYVENFSGNVMQYINSNMSSTRGNFESINDLGFYAFAYIFEFYFVLDAPMVVFVNADSRFISEQPMFEVLLLAENEKDAYIACDQYFEDEIGVVIDFIKNENPNLTESQALELTNFMKKNLIQIIKATK